jgi:hypothetical protein
MADWRTEPANRAERLAWVPRHSTTSGTEPRWRLIHLDLEHRLGSETARGKAADERQRPTLLGRSDECAQLDGLMKDIQRGESRSMVLRGEAGIGKTALLKYLVTAASDLTVVRAVGAESDMELPFASLHQLCGPMLDRLPRLPEPQRQALEIVFGLSAGGAPDRFLAGLGVLTLMSEAADTRPLLCVVDDAHWLDQASALTLAFVARRLLAEPVGIVFAAREAIQELRHLPELEILGLRDGAARALLRSAVRSRLDDRVRDRIIAETRGNPLALLELPRGLTTTELAGGFGVPGSPGLTEQIRESFVRQLSTLTDAAQRLVLLAAAEPVGDPLHLFRGRPVGDLAGDRGRGGIARAARHRRPGALPASAGAFRRLPISGGAGTPGGPPRIGRGDRTGRRS